LRPVVSIMFPLHPLGFYGIRLLVFSFVP
jgi:hypothetical protein